MLRGRTRPYKLRHNDGVGVAPIPDKSSARLQRIAVVGFVRCRRQRLVRHPNGYPVHEHFGLRGNLSVRQPGTRTPSSSRKLNV